MLDRSPVGLFQLLETVLAGARSTWAFCQRDEANRDMIFGDPNDVAIEAMTETHLVAPSAVWGRMCLHIGSVVLGDYTDEHCGLTAHTADSRNYSTFRLDCGMIRFLGLSHEQIHDLVRHAIYGDDDRSMTEILADSKRYRIFDLLSKLG